MRKYYEELKKIEDFSSFDRSKLLEYIHRQKFEATAISLVEPVFWVELDYIIGLAKYALTDITEEKKELFIKYVYPLMQEKIAPIKKIEKALPENEFFYLRQDLKTFEDIFSHASNLINKRCDYFLPFSLFLHAINSMTVLYPLNEKTCDAGMIARTNYNILQARLLSGRFSEKLVDIIDYLIWVQAVFQKAVDPDRYEFRNQIIRRLSAFIDTEDSCEKTEDLTGNLVSEIHENLTYAHIKSKIQDLLANILSTKITTNECLKKIIAIFLNPQEDLGPAITFRDLSTASDLAASVIKHIKEGNNKGLYEDIALSKALKHIFMSVSRYMFDIQTDIEVCRLFEIMFYLEETAPSFIMHDDIIPLLESSIERFEDQKKRFPKEISDNFDPQAAELFKANAMQVYAGKLS